jgi:hypothetical protein
MHFKRSAIFTPNFFMKWGFINSDLGEFNEVDYLLNRYTYPGLEDYRLGLFYQSKTAYKLAVKASNEIQS